MATIDELADRLLKIDKRLEGPASSANTNNINTIFNAGGIGVVVGIAGVFLGLTGMYVINDRAESRMAVMVEARRADMAQLAALMSRTEGVESQVRADRILITKAEQRITLLEGDK